MQGQKIEAWFVSQASREYFDVQPAAFLSANNFIKKSTHCKDELAAKKFFFS